MKLFPFVLAIVVLASCARTHKATITGTIDRIQPGETAFLEEITPSGLRMVDSAAINKKGNFKLSAPLVRPGFYQLSVFSGQKLTLILQPGDKITFTTDIQDFYTRKTLEGSPVSARVNLLHDSLRHVSQTLLSIEKEYAQADSISPEGIQLREQLSKKYDAIMENYHRFSAGFVIEDLASLANVAALYQEYAPGYYVFHKSSDLQYFKLVRDTLSKYYPQVGMVTNLQNNFSTFYKQYTQMQLLQKAQPREVAFHYFELPDLHGNIKSMHNLSDKLVLLSFWSNTEASCVANNQELLPIYKKYHGQGFEIYQVGLTRNMANWQSAVRFENFPWISVCDTAYPNSESLRFYHVSSVPTNYLIDLRKPDILARDLTPGQLDHTLNHLLNR